MKQLLIYFSIISLFCPLWAQEKPKQSTEPIPYKILIGVDLLNPSMQFWSHKKGYEGFISVPIYKKLQAVAEAGYEQNKYEQNNWDVNLNGFFARLGFDWYIDSDHKNLNNGYYLGARLGYSPYQVNIEKFPIKNQGGEIISAPLGETSSHAIWVAPVVGARVNLGNSRFYVDANAQLNLLAINQDKMDFEAFAIPGFGKSNNGLNLRILWTIGFAL